MLRKPAGAPKSRSSSFGFAGMAFHAARKVVPCGWIFKAPAGALRIGEDDDFLRGVRALRETECRHAERVVGAEGATGGLQFVEHAQHIGPMRERRRRHGFRARSHRERR